MKQLSLLLLFSLKLLSQPGICFVGIGPGVGVTAGCPCIGTQNPCVQQYITSINSVLTTDQGSITAKRQNYIPSGMQLVGAEADYIEQDTTGCQLTNPNSCIFANATLANNFIDNVIVPSEAKYLDWNIDMLPYIFSPEYTALGGTCSLGSPYNTKLTYILSVYDSIMLHAVSKGLKIRLSPISFGPIWAACGLTAGTQTLPQIVTALTTIEGAISNHLYSSLGINNTVFTDFIVMHEPTEAGNLFLGQTLSPANWASLVGSLCAEVVLVTGGGQACGTAFSYADSTYISEYATTANLGTTTIGGIDFYYGPTLSTWTTQATTYSNWCNTFRTNGLTCKVNESGPWGHCPNGGSACGGALYEGCGWKGLYTYNVNNAWGWFISHFASAMGASYFTIFAVQPFGMYQAAAQSSPNACTDNSPTGYTAQVWQNTTGLTTSGQGWRDTTGFRYNVSNQGKILINGH
jgi:hypothetical protein